MAIKQLKNMDENRMIGRRAIDGFQKAREEFFKESHILRILHHPHLVQVNLNPIHINQPPFVCLIWEEMFRYNPNKI